LVLFFYYITGSGACQKVFGNFSFFSVLFQIVFNFGGYTADDPKRNRDESPGFGTEKEDSI